MLRYVALILLILLIALEIKLWAGEGGMRDVWRLEQRLAEQKLENQKLKQRNEALSAEVQDLKTGTAAVEERARFELGMIKKDEIFVQILDAGSKVESKPQVQGKVTAAKTN